MLHRRFLAVVLAAGCILPACAASGTSLPQIITQDNTQRAGVLKDGVLTVHLYVGEGAWHPYQDGGPWLPVLAFGEEGHELENPGPLIRVPDGTEIVASVRNPMKFPVFVHGLETHPGKTANVLRIMPGKTEEVRFNAGAAGTYFYWATSRTHDGNGNIAARDACDSQLNGALVVDPPGDSTKDRILLISLWAQFLVPADFDNGFHELPVINGKSWPYTTRLTYTMGDTIQWRVINASPAHHPMHMHGAFFTVNSRGDAMHDVAYTPEQRPMVVTEDLPPGDTMAMTWTPVHAGGWVFHCHIEAHFDPDIASTVAAVMGSDETQPASHDAHMMEQHPGMAGLVLGVRVLPGITPTAATRTGPMRRITMTLRPRPATPGHHADIAVEFNDGQSKIATAADAEIGPPLVLYRGQRTEITIENHLAQPTAIHWHGIELESYYDGVVGFSGDSRQVTPPIPAGGTFVARMTPPRAGTFIYHTHWHDVDQLTSGEYGALIVLEPGQKYDPETDRVFLASRGGTDAVNDTLLINGSPRPPQERLRAGVSYRFRLVNITPNDVLLHMRLLMGETPVKWRAIGKDGAALPPEQATVREAEQQVSVGETYDFEFKPIEPGTLQLAIDESSARLPSPIHRMIPLVVEPAMATAKATVPEEVKK